MDSSEQEPMMESDDDEQMDNAPQNGIDEDLNSSQGKVSNYFLTFFSKLFIRTMIFYPKESLVAIYTPLDP